MPQVGFEPSVREGHKVRICEEMSVVRFERKESLDGDGEGSGGI